MMPEEDYCLTKEQKSINVLIRLRGRFITMEDVLEIEPNYTYDEARQIASACNEYLLEMQRYLYRKV